MTTSTIWLTVGLAPHSLRAVTPEQLREVAAMQPGGPIHIHAAEQVREVEDCLAWSGSRPVEWLLNHMPVGPDWCLIHATHMTPGETERLAALFKLKSRPGDRDYEEPIEIEPSRQPSDPSKPSRPVADSSKARK